MHVMSLCISNASKKNWFEHLGTTQQVCMLAGLLHFECKKVQEWAEVIMHRVCILGC